MKEKRRGRYGADDDWLREMIGWWKDHSKSHLRVGGEPAELGIQPVGGGAGGGAEGRTRWRLVWPARERNAGCGRRSSPEGIWPGSLVGSFRLWGCVQRPRSRHPQTGLGGPHPDTESEGLGGAPDCFEILLGRILARVEAQPAVARRRSWNAA